MSGYNFKKNLLPSSADSSGADVSGNFFGSAIYRTENRLFIGAKFERDSSNSNDDRKGAVHIYNLNNFGCWQNVSKIQPNNLVTNDKFGSNIFVDENDNHKLYISADGNDGKVYIYSLNSSNSYQLFQTIDKPSNIATGQGFGKNVEILNNNLFVSCTGENKVLVYKKNQYGHWETTFNSIAGESGDSFGYGLLSHGDKLYVGCPGNNKVKIFTKNSYGSFEKKGSITGDSGQNFGTSLTKDDKFIVIGASSHDSNKGIVYFYKLNNFGAFKKKSHLKATTRTAEKFGSKIFVYEKELYVGGPLNDEASSGNSADGGENSGKIYIYEKN